MATQKGTLDPRRARMVQPWREESLVVAGVGGVVAALGYVPMGAAIVVIAVVVFTLGFLSRRPAPPEPAMAAPPKKAARRSAVTRRPRR